MQTFTHTQRVIQGVCGWDRSHGVLLNHICDCDPPLDPLEDWGPPSPCSAPMTELEHRCWRS